jgi:electron transfer flavoprotein beta subunit
MIAVCIKWIGDSATPGLSAADQAALEMALRHAASARTSLVVVTAGGAAADEGLRSALACGATTAIRVDASADTESAAVAEALAPVVAHSSAVWCGDYSADRGTGSVPAFLAGRLRRQQALGLIAVELGPPVRVTRRLDGGRREVLNVTGPSVLSVEGSIASLRRAPLRAALASQTADVLLYGTTAGSIGAMPVTTVRPYRPRARVLAAPSGATALERLQALTDASAAPQPGETIEASPAAAARRIVEVLGGWGYLDLVR